MKQLNILHNSDYDIKKEIIFEDDDILVINKPTNLLTIQDGYSPNLPNISQLLQQIYKNIWVVHRLDKQTSGAIIFTKNAFSHKAISLQFQNRNIKKEYHTITFGKISWHEKSVEMPLRVNGDRKHRTLPDLENGKPAKTSFRLINSFEEYSFLSAFPYTGYRHQIRAHLKWIGLEVVGDELYGKLSKTQQHSVPINRLALHARRIEFNHPRTKEILSIHAPYPQDFSKALIWLKLDPETS